MTADCNKKYDEPCWYAIYTNPNQEVRAESNLRAWGLETFNPKIKAVRRNPFTDAPNYVTKPLFPRYVFARFNAASLLHKVWFTRGVHSVVTFDESPARVDDEIIALLRAQEGEDGFVRLGDDFKYGDKVRIESGSFKDLVGILDRDIKDNERVMLLLTSLSYQGRVEIEKERVRKVS